MARAYDPYSLSSPWVYLIRMMIFLAVVAFIALILYRQIASAFMSNPGLNGLIIGTGLVGILLAIRQVIRLMPEVNWVNGFRLGDPGIEVRRPPVLLAPMATLLGNRAGETMLSPATMRSILDSIGMRLDEAREMARYLTGLLVFLGLLGTFWGLLQTVGSVNVTIQSLDVGSGDANVIFEDLKAGLEAPLAGMGTAFSSSLFGLTGSLILGFLDLQAGQAQNRFYNELEDWLSTLTDIEPEDGAGGGGLRSGRVALRHRQPAQGRGRGRWRRRPQCSGRHGQPRRGNPGPRPARSQRAADDARLGRRAIGTAEAHRAPAPLHVERLRADQGRGEVMRRDGSH